MGQMVQHAPCTCQPASANAAARHWLFGWQRLPVRANRQAAWLNGWSSGGIIGIGLGAHDPLSTFRAIAIKAPIAALMRQQPTQPIRSFLRNIQPAFDGRNQRLIGEIRINLRTRRIPFTNRQRADGAIRVHKRLQIDARRRLRRTGCMCNRATINPGNSHANRCH